MTVSLLDLLLAVMATEAAVDPSEVRSQSRTRQMVKFRRWYAYVARNAFDASYPEIIRAVGRTGHASAIEWCRKHAANVSHEDRDADVKAWRRWRDHIVRQSVLASAPVD